MIFISSLFSVEYCSNPGPVENGHMEGTGPFSCISTVKYTCDDSYWLLGAETLGCTKDGQWDNGKPSCISSSKKQKSSSERLDGAKAGGCKCRSVQVQEGARA